MDNSKKRCAIYARVSLEEQTEKFGLSSQLTELRTHAAKAGYEAIHELIDEGYSGADLGRPALNTVRDLVRSRSVNVVLVHDPDRLSRKLAHQLVLTEEFERAGISLEFVTTPVTDSMEGRLLLNIRGVISEFEREKIRERTMRGRREKARQGLLVGGRRPYGYHYHEGTYAVDETEAQVIVNIFRWLVEEGLSIRRIIERLNQEGHRPHTSARWAKSTISRILRNETYIGRAFYNRRQAYEPETPSPLLRRNKKTRLKWRPQSDWIEQSAPPIISGDLFQAAQVKLRQNSAHCSGRPSKFVYLLRGILKCSLCGRKYVGHPAFADKYYRCIGHERLAQPRCAAPSISAKTIETFVWDYVVRLLLNPSLLLEKLSEQPQDEPGLEAELAVREKQIKEIRRKQDRLLEAMLDSDMPLPGMRAKAKELEQRGIALQREYDQLQSRLAMRYDRSRLKERVMQYCGALGMNLPSLDLFARQKLLRAVLDDVIVDGNQVSLRGILPLPVETAKPSTMSAHCGCRPPRLRGHAWPSSGRERL